MRVPERLIGKYLDITNRGSMRLAMWRETARGLLAYFREPLHAYVDFRSHPVWSTYRSDPPIQYTLRPLADICHYLNVVPARNSRPFIIEYEHVLHLSGESLDYEKMKAAVPKIRSLLEDWKCRRIVVPTYGTVRESKRYLGSGTWEKKVRVVHLGYPVQPQREPNRGAHFRLLTIGNKFWMKGIPIAVDVFRVLRSEYGDKVSMVLVCNDIPDGFSGPSGLDILRIPRLPDWLRYRLYRKADAFLFPCVQDSFGVYLESMAHGVPVVGTRIYDKDEVVLDGQTGYLVDSPLSLYDGPFGVEWKSSHEFDRVIEAVYREGGFDDVIDALTVRLRRLIEDSELRGRMSQAAQEFHRAEWSIARRNDRILSIYREALFEV